MLWRSRHEIHSLSARQVELLYQSTLDSISEAWCISHPPVSAYVAEARAAVYEAGLAPDVVLATLKRPMPESLPVKSSMLLLGGEAAELGETDAVYAAAEILRNNRNYHDVEVLVIATSALAYCLGAREIAYQQALQLVDRIAYSGATEVIADGPQALWALRRVLPVLGVSLPEGVRISSLSEKLAEEESVAASSLSPSHNGNGALHRAVPAKNVFFLDSRSATLVADSMASGDAIQPGFQGPESTLGTGEVFEAPRRFIDALGMKQIYNVWSRSLAKSCGADDGLWLTYPALADRLARQRLQEAKQCQADFLVTDSLLSARHLALNAECDDVRVRWLPELIAEASSCTT